MRFNTIRERGLKTRVALVCVLAVELAVVGCRPRPLALPGEAGDPRELPGSTSTRNRARTRGPQDLIESKHVAGKEAPSTLIATDDSRCSVPEPRYREIAIGERILCVWRTGNRAP